MARIDGPKSTAQVEADIRQIETEEKIERMASFFTPFLRAILLTAAVLYIFNRLIF
ncbi:hypothetical protein L6R21_10280 [bacterium]|nr:hypothetical protein [bacterium]